MCERDLREFEGESIEEQRDRVEAAFVRGSVTAARGEVHFTEDQLARLDRVSEHGGFLNRYEYEYLKQLRAGRGRGEPLPAAPSSRQPYINGVGEDFEVRIATQADRASVVVLFSHERWPGVRFGHRFPPPSQSDGYEMVWLKEEIETGGLSRLMNRDLGPDHDGIVWTDWANR